MKCERCQFEVAAEFAFCPRCGTRLAAATTAAATDADRRSATVLFADLSGFTALSERLDPEDVRLLQLELFDALRGVVERLGGFVEKFVGDAVMAVFGAPVAHEDDPQRALRAALEMHECVGLLGKRWQDRLGRPLALHIGVNSGRVVAGRLGSAADAAYAVTGDAVNIAARLQAAAEGGQTLVSRATFFLTQREFTFEPCGDLTLKGKADPLPVYRLLGTEERAGATRGLAALGLAAPLVGRDPELAQLLEVARITAAGRAQVVSLVAEAGMGKSRLVDALLDRIDTTAGSSPTTVRRVQCSSLTQQPYGIFASLCREGYGIEPADTLEVARRKVEDGLRKIGADAAEIALVAPVVGYILGLHALDQLREIEPEQLNRQILVTLRTLLERRLAHGPLLLVVEDMQWADAASISGLRTLPDLLCDRPLLVVLAGRPPFEPGSEYWYRAGHTALRLGPLANDSIEAILTAFFGAPDSDRVPAELRQIIVRQAGGNPFYLDEVVRSLIAAGVLMHDAGGWRCQAGSRMVEVPSSIEGLLLSRVDRLPQRARRLLQGAAIIGPVFEWSLLSAVDADASDPEMLGLLCEAELLAPTVGAIPAPVPLPHPLERYRFAGDMLHDVVYQNMLLRRRTQLHQRAGEVLERLRGSNPERLDDLEALCRHFTLGEDPARGARYLVAAGDWARGIYANEDALRYYGRALNVLESPPAADVEAIDDVRERLGDLLGPIGRREEAGRYYVALLEGARARGDAVREARMQRKLAGMHWDAGERDRSFACLREGLRLLEGRIEDIELALLYQEMGRLAFRTGDNPVAVQWAERALHEAEREAARGHDSPHTRREAAAAIAHALNTMGAALARLGRTQEAVGFIERSVAVAHSEGLLQAACRSYANLGVLYATLDPGRAVQTCQTGLDTARKIGDLGFQSRLYANLAVAYCALTQRCDEDGLQAAQSAIEIDRRLGQLDHLAVPLIVLGQIHQCHGDADTALRYYEEALGLSEEIGEPQLLFPCYDGLATVYLDRGDRIRAEEYLIKADRVCESAGIDRDSLVVLPFLC